MNKENRLRGKKFSLFVYLFFFLFFISLVGALDVFEDSNVVGVNIQPPQIPVLLPDTDWNGGWMNGGCSIEGGNIYCQQAFLYNLSSLNVTKKNLTVLDDLIIDGNVGIGTATPSYPLSISTKSGGNDFGVDTLGDLSRVTFRIGALSFMDFRDTTQDYVDFNPSNSDMDFSVRWDTTTALFIEGSSGRIGIGTVTPSDVLEVVGGVRVGSASFVANQPRMYRDTNLGLTLTGIASGIKDFTIAESGGSKLISNPQGTYDVILAEDGGGAVGVKTATPQGVFDVRVAGDKHLAIRFNSNPEIYTVNDAGSANLPLQYQATEHHFKINADTKVKIDSAGKVGIGTVTPSWKLDINSGTIDAPLQLNSTDSSVVLRMVDDTTSNPATLKRIGDNLALVPDGGNVGIGTASPLKKLDVYQGNIALGRVSGIPYGMMWYAGDDSYRMRIQGNSSSTVAEDFLKLEILYGSIRFLTNNKQEVMRITDSERVGIGTTNPLQKLNVVGDVNFSGSGGNYALFNSNSSLRLFGNARVKKINNFGVGQSVGGGTAPTTTIVGIFPVAQFSQNPPVESLYFSRHPNTDRDTSENISVHIHWSPTDSNSGDVVWDIDFVAVTPENNEVLNASVTSLSVTDSTQSLENELLQTATLQVVGTDIPFNDVVAIKISRDTNDGADTYGASASFVELHVGYISNSLGENV